MKARELRRTVEDFIMGNYDRSVRELNRRRYPEDVCNYLESLTLVDLHKMNCKLNEIVDNIELYRKIVSISDN